jgi:hypothetical protein
VQSDVARRDERHAPILVRLRVGRHETAHHCVHVRTRLFDADALLQASGDEHPAVPPPLQPRLRARRRDGIDDPGRLDFVHVRRRHPHLGREDGQHTGELARRHADDRVRLSAQADRLADRVARGAELTLPVAVRHDRDAVRARPIVARLERAAERRVDPEDLEVVAGDDFAECQPRPIPVADDREHRAVASDVVEDGVLRAHVDQIRMGGAAPGLAVAAARVDRYEPLGVAAGHRAQQQCVDDGEKRGVNADRDRDRRDSGDGEAGAAAHPPQRKACVLKEISHDATSSWAAPMPRDVLSQELRRRRPREGARAAKEIRCVGARSSVVWSYVMT